MNKQGKEPVLRLSLHRSSERNRRFRSLVNLPAPVFLLYFYFPNNNPAVVYIVNAA